MKNKYLLVDSKDPQKIPIEWIRLKSETFDNIPSTRLYNRESINPINGEVVTRTVIFLKKVDEFNKNIRTFDEDEIIIGIPD